MRREIGASEGASLYLLAVCVSNVLALLLSLILANVHAGWGGMSAFDWSGYALMQVGFLGVTLVFQKVRGWDFKRVARLGAPVKLGQFILTPFIAIATILVFLPLANAWGAFLDVIGFKGGVVMPDYSNVGVYFLSLFIMAVVPAVGEELLMRGGVFSSLSSRGVWFGVLISALLFSLMHANPMQTVHQFGLGAVLAITVALTGSVWSAALVHFFNNFVSITVTAYMPAVDEAYVKLGYFNWLTGAASVVVGLFILLALLYALYVMGEGRAVSPRIEYEGFSIYVPEESAPKKLSQRLSGHIKGYLRFIRSLFTKEGWRGLTAALTRRNDVQLICSREALEANGQRSSAALLGVWLAIGFSAVYWLVSFIEGLI